MNKARRHELKMLKYKRRIRLYQLGKAEASAASNLFAFRSHGKPCSCFLCRDEKYNRAKQTQRLNAILQQRSKE